MDYRIVHRRAFSVIGMKKDISFKEGGSQFNAFWKEARQGDKAQDLKDLGNGDIDGMLSITLEADEDDIDVVIMLAYTTDELYYQGEFDLYHFPAASWLVLDVVGKPSKAMRPVWKKLNEGELIPYGFEMADVPAFEAYIDDNLSSDDSKNEIWVALKNN